MLDFWVVNQVTLDNFQVMWAPGLKILADYFTKHHVASDHKKVRPYYLSCLKSPGTLTRAPSPISLQGCVNSSNGSYQRDMPPLAQPSQYTKNTRASSTEWRLTMHNNTRYGQTARSSYFLPAAESVIGHLGPRTSKCPAMKKAYTRILSLLERFTIAFNKSSLAYVWQHSCFRQTYAHNI